MPEITFTTTLNGQQKKITFRQVSGSAGSIHIMCDNFYHGQFVINNGRWVGYPAEASELWPILPAMTEFVRKSFPS